MPAVPDRLDGYDDTVPYCFHAFHGFHSNVTSGIGSERGNADGGGNDDNVVVVTISLANVVRGASSRDWFKRFGDVVRDAGIRHGVLPRHVGRVAAHQFGG